MGYLGYSRKSPPLIPFGSCGAHQTRSSNKVDYECNVVGHPRTAQPPRCVPSFRTDHRPHPLRSPFLPSSPVLLAAGRRSGTQSPGCTYGTASCSGSARSRSSRSPESGSSPVSRRNCHPAVVGRTHSFFVVEDVWRRVELIQHHPRVFWFLASFLGTHTNHYLAVSFHVPFCVPRPSPQLECGGQGGRRRRP